MAPHSSSCLENPMDGGAWRAAVHGVAKSRTRLSDFTFTFHFHALEREMATHSNVLAWRIPGTGEPGGCRLWGHRVGHDWSDLAAAAALYLLYYFHKCKDCSRDINILIQKSECIKVPVQYSGLAWRLAILIPSALNWLQRSTWDMREFSRTEASYLHRVRCCFLPFCQAEYINWGPLWAQVECFQLHNDWMK